MSVFKKREGKYLEMPFFEYHLGRFACHLIVKLLEKSYKRHDKHEFNHVVTALSVISTHQCLESCLLNNEDRGYLSPGEIVPVEVLL